MMVFQEAPPVTHPTVSVCGGPSFLCNFNIDSVVSTLVAVGVTLALGFWIAASLRRGVPG